MQIYSFSWICKPKVIFCVCEGRALCDGYVTTKTMAATQSSPSLGRGTEGVGHNKKVPRQAKCENNTNSPNGVSGYDRHDVGRKPTAPAREP